MKRNRDNRPPCGTAGCTKRASYVSSAGVGYCAEHREEGCIWVGAEVGCYDQWWRWASLAREAGGEEWERWEHCMWDEYPEGWDKSHRCGAPTKDGGTCRRAVSGPGVRCWAHGGEK